MPDLETLPAPVLVLDTEAKRHDKWRAEQRAFRRLLPDLLGLLRGQYVAIHEGQVVESGADKLDVAGRAYARFGYVPIYVTLVTDETPTPVRIPSPRMAPREKPS